MGYFRRPSSGRPSKGCFCGTNKFDNAFYEDTVCHKGSWKRRALAFVADRFLMGGHRQKLLAPRNTWFSKKRIHSKISFLFLSLLCIDQIYPSGGLDICGRGKWRIGWGLSAWLKWVVHQQQKDSISIGRQGWYLETIAKTSDHEWTQIDRPPPSPCLPTKLPKVILPWGWCKPHYVPV